MLEKMRSIISCRVLEGRQQLLGGESVNPARRGLSVVFSVYASFSAFRRPHVLDADFDSSGSSGSRAIVRGSYPQCLA